MENIRFREVTEEDGEPWRKVKNIGALERRSLAIVRDLYAWRDVLARKADRPPFKVLGNDALVDIAKEKPPTVRELSLLKSVSRYHADRYGRDLAGIVRRALEIPEADLPEKSEPKPWIRDKSLESRIDRLKRVRDKYARELKIDGSVLAPRHILAAIATNNTLDVPAMREWQKRLMGEELLKVIEPEKKLF
jgi:ribonuclease D